MARINVEDDYWTDPRREALGILVGDQEKADGRMLRAWRVSQAYAKKGELIPFKLWEASNFGGVVESGLATVRSEGVYVCGAKAHFGWLKARLDAARKGGGGEANGKQTASKPEANGKQIRLSENPLTLTPALALDRGEVNPAAAAGDGAIAQEWLEWARTQLPGIKANPPKWAEAARLIRECDGVDTLELRAVLAFVKGDEFWRRNAVSLPGLRQRSKNGLTKLENIKLAMHHGAGRHQERPRAETPILRDDD